MYNNSNNGDRELQSTDKLCASSTYASIVVDAVHKFDRRRVYSQRPRLVMGKFSKSRVWDKVPERSTPVLRDTPISLKHSVG